jgi:hypothetical protein
MGCWSEVQRFGGRKEAPGMLRARGEPHAFDVLRGGLKIARVEWALLGEHNQLNALAAMAAAEHVGVVPEISARALASFRNVRRRLELRGVAAGVSVYDDFAHHPTAMRTTLEGLRRKVGAARILAVFEPRSNTMKLGAMKAQLPWALEEADLSFCHSGGLTWDAAQALAPMGARAVVVPTIAELVSRVVAAARSGRSHPVHEQRRLRRHPREAARGPGAARPRRGMSGATAGRAGHAPPLPARLSLVAAVDQGEEVRRLGRGEPARAGLVVPAAAGVAGRGDARGDGRRLDLARRAHGRDRQLARRLLRDRRRRAARLPRVLLNPGVDPARDLADADRRDDGVAQRRAVRLPPRVRRRAARDRAAGDADRPGPLLRRHRQGRRGAVMARDERALRRRPGPADRRKRPRAQ